jgi:protein involved in polysaccharide export with SLBB domain
MNKGQYRLMTLSVFIMCAIFLLNGCATAPVAPVLQETAGPIALGPGDRVRVIIFGQTQLSGDFLIADDGNLSLPLVGRIHLAGLTVAKSEEILRERLAQGIVTDPHVSIDIIHYRPVYVIGEVTRPGGYEPIGQLSVIDAVALAGGFTYRAKTDQLTLLRESDPQKSPIPVTNTTPIAPGDVIIIPERWF